MSRIRLMALLIDSQKALNELAIEQADADAAFAAQCKTLADLIGDFPVTHGLTEDDLRNEHYAASRLQPGAPIDGVAGEIGDIVFWVGDKPYWIVEWQPDNGEVYAIVNAKGEIGLAAAEDLTRDFRNRR